MKKHFLNVNDVSIFSNILLQVFIIMCHFFQNDSISSLYIIQRGRVRLIMATNQMNTDAWDLIRTKKKQVKRSQENGNYVVEIDEGGHFGEWALIGETIFFTAISVGDVTCSTISKENFDSIAGPLPKLSTSDSR
jgi:CRP-like cAMP-binding protein